MISFCDPHVVMYEIHVLQFLSQDFLVKLFSMLNIKAISSGFTIQCIYGELYVRGSHLDYFFINA